MRCHPLQPEILKRYQRADVALIGVAYELYKKEGTTY